LKKGIKEEFFNLPNTITLARISILPVSLVLLSYDTPANCFWAAFLFSVASSTDFVDGWIARSYNLITVTGKFLDPLADKLIVICTLIVLLPMGRIPAWAVILIIVRELSVTSLRALAAGEGMVMAAGQEGKWKAALQMTGIVSLMIHYPQDIDLLLFRVFFHFHEVGLVLVYISLFFSVLSAGRYIAWFAGEAGKMHKEDGG
jgi:CDP-diacylglycerol--glycerol-3-phosphate 3-phosphatidyltransferase